jgi:small-conductance mechanosensitive channel
MVRMLIEIVIAAGCFAAAVLALARLRTLRRDPSPDLRATSVVLAASALIGVGLSLYVASGHTALPAGLRQQVLVVVLFVGIGLLNIADTCMHSGLIVSDCDGTLVDSKPGATTVWLEVAAE